MSKEREAEEKERIRFLEEFSKYFEKEYKKNGNSFDDNIDGYNNFLLDKLEEFKEIKEKNKRKRG